MPRDIGRAGVLPSTSVPPPSAVAASKFPEKANLRTPLRLGYSRKFRTERNTGVVGVLTSARKTAFSFRLSAATAIASRFPESATRKRELVKPPIPFVKTDRRIGLDGLLTSTIV